jgi:hypothetical protein
MKIEPKIDKATEKSIARELEIEMWKAGELSWILYKHQMPMYGKIRQFLDADPKLVGLKYTINCSRRFGKTFTLLLLAVEFGYKNPGCEIRFAAPSKAQLKKIIHPSMTKIYKSCPFAYRPKWRAGDSYYAFPNGSKLHLAGCDDAESMEALRGTESHLNIVTEGGSIGRLDYLIKDILIPQTITTKGKTFVDSTPPPDPHHYFNLLVDESRKVGNYCEYTIDDNTSIPDDVKEVYINEAGGRDDPTCQREYFCKRTRDVKNAIIKEFSAEKHVKKLDIPKNFQYLERYMALDLGLVDKTVNLFAFYDYNDGRLKVQAETVCQGKDMTTLTLGKQILKDQKELWGDLPVYKQISDNNQLQTINDMNQMHGFSFVATRKKTLHGMVNDVRNMFAQDRIWVDISCVELIGCLDSGIWNKRRSEFDHHPVWGHFDALAALVYMVINLDQENNPLPLRPRDYERNFYNTEAQELSEAEEELKRRFGWTKTY